MVFFDKLPVPTWPRRYCLERFWTFITGKDIVVCKGSWVYGVMGLWVCRFMGLWVYGGHPDLSELKKGDFANPVN
jgi:hypothetical protein